MRSAQCNVAKNTASVIRTSAHPASDVQYRRFKLRWLRQQRLQLPGMTGLPQAISIANTQKDLATKRLVSDDLHV